MSAMSLIPNRASRAKYLLVVLACAFGIYWYLSDHVGNSADDASQVQPYAANHRTLLRNFSLLRQRPERMPRRLQHKVLTTLDASAGGLKLSDAQYAPTVAGGVWVAYGRRIACIVQAPDGNVGCKPLSMATRRGIVLGIGAPPDGAGNLPDHFLVVGLAPDWAKAVRVRVGESKAQTIPVRKNVYSLQAPELIVVERLERLHKTGQTASSIRSGG